jgi:hypothetical protein
VNVRAQQYGLFIPIVLDYARSPLLLVSGACGFLAWRSTDLFQHAIEYGST